MLITVLDTRLTPRSPGVWDSSDSECSALTHFSMSLAHIYVNLKEPQDIKEQVTSNFFLKKEDRLYMKSPNLKELCAGVFQIQSPNCSVNFSPPA